MAASSTAFDHDEVTLYLRESASMPTKTAARRVAYPIRGSHSERLVEDLLRELKGKSLIQGPGHLSGTSNAKIDEVHHSESSEAATKQCCQAAKQARENVCTQNHLLKALVADMRDRGSARVSNRLKRTLEDIGWLFQ